MNAAGGDRLRRGWLGLGTELLFVTMDRLDDAALDQPTGLPGWTRRHVLAHLASNAEALRRLAGWARTGQPNPMYASPEQRAADIAQGATLSPQRLRDRVRTSAHRLAADLAELPDPAWQARVITAQGRTVPASEIPWMRTREVAVHAVDLAGGTEFADLPADLLAALIADVTARRSSLGDGPKLHLRTTDDEQVWRVDGHGEPVTVSAPLDVLARWLTGRADQPPPGAPAPALPAWL
ncbi:maleylpyruvate isomerase family mycothiol-dependent enzyme [Micromonospora sp. NPDC005206]|uniref:maleylpyruvate isomerase family mycothiol-dependent enzyme n=1 Tax=Micromonospora sp. NPDC005206 TaxID=3157022 RepID=UPI0033BE89CD